MNAGARGLANFEVAKVVDDYIGLAGGYLGDFSYASHAEFYGVYCDLDIDMNQYQGTTRQRFIAILTSLSPAEQAKVLRGVVERFPPNDRPGSTRTPALGDDLLGIARRLDAASPIDQRQPKPATPPALSTREAVEAFKTGLLAYATGGAFDASEHRVLRQQLLSDALLRARLPDFVSTCADPGQFWGVH